MYRTHTCGELRLCNAGQTVTLAGWVQKVRNLGAMTFFDLRDRYGLVQVAVEEHSPETAREAAAEIGREYVLQVTGRVVERSSKNPKMPTGEIEIAAESIVNTGLIPLPRDESTCTSISCSNSPSALKLPRTNSSKAARSARTGLRIESIVTIGIIALTLQR